MWLILRKGGAMKMQRISGKWWRKKKKKGILRIKEDMGGKEGAGISGTY